MFFPSVFDEIEEKIKNLFPKIQNLGKIAQQIKVAAGQTNFLARNVPVKAAYADDCGKVCAFMTDEVKAPARQRPEKFQERFKVPPMNRPSLRPKIPTPSTISAKVHIDRPTHLFGY